MVAQRDDRHTAAVTQQHENEVAFAARQILDTLCPVELPLRRIPDLMRKTIEEGGANLARGAQNFIEDWERVIRHQPPGRGWSDFKVGRNAGHRARQGGPPQPV